jgi:hypothetical protein
MAILTSHLLMYAFKRKGGGSMLEVFSISLVSIMTFQALPAKDTSVFLHGSFIKFVMTIHALIIAEYPYCSVMTIETRQPIQGFLSLMRTKRESNLGVRKLDAVVLRDLSVSTFMLGMTCVTGNGSVKARVQSPRRANLFLDHGMTFQTTVPHEIITPKGCMACITVSREISMISHSANPVLAGARR